MSKGQLEMTIYEAQNLSIEPGFNVDIFCRAALRANTHTIKAKKTHKVHNSIEPQFNCKLKFTASEVLGRRIQVVKLAENFLNFILN